MRTPDHSPDFSPRVWKGGALEAAEERPNAGKVNHSRRAAGALGCARSSYRFFEFAVVVLRRCRARGMPSAAFPFA